MIQSERPGYGGLTILLAFAGGALAGGIAAALLTPRSGPETRRLIGGAVASGKERLAEVAGETGQAASRLPQALREASSAASEAFTAALRDGA